VKGRRPTNKIASSIALLGALLVLASCLASTGQPARSPEASRQIAKALAGYRVGQPVRCIPGYPRTRMEIIDDHTLLFRGNQVIYLQSPLGGCYGLKGQFTALVTQTWGPNQLCQGDINQLVYNGGGMGGGSCAFGPFVPYTKGS
jgi:hypothetical protein